jgi:hypothetical protein
MTELCRIAMKSGKVRTWTLQLDRASAVDKVTVRNLPKVRQRVVRGLRNGI